MPQEGLMAPVPDERLSLPQVTLCAVSSSNVAATVRALEASLRYIKFADALLFTDFDAEAGDFEISPEIDLVGIDRLNTAEDYSEFILSQLVDYVQTSHCMVVQWDGHVIDPARWQNEFFDFDYIGATWPQFDDGRTVGNGGFTLRSRRLMEACRAPEFVRHHPEDIAICRTNRALLDEKGMQFAPEGLANNFSAERAGDPSSSFGYHGVFLMPRVLGPNDFWEVYRTLDERSSLRRDFGMILRSLHYGQKPVLRSLSMLGGRLSDALIPRT